MTAMLEGQTIAVVVPAYNEEDNIGTVIRTVPSFVDRVYAIDDASTDQTWEEINRSATRANETPVERSITDGGVEGPSRVIPVKHEQNRGAGGAVKTGYSLALSDEMDVTAVMDGDGQMDPEELERILRPVVSGEVTYAKGNRLFFSEDRKNMSRWRFFGNSLLTMLTRISSGYWELSDPQNGFTAISLEGLRKVPLERLYDGYGFLNHLLISLNVNGESIADVAHGAVYGDETSGINYSTFVPGLSLLLLRGYLSRLVQSYLVRRFHPLIACYVMGAVAMVVGILGVTYATVSPSVNGFLGGMTSFGVLLLGGLLGILGSWFDIKENEGLVHHLGHPGMRSVPGERDRSPTTQEPIEAVHDGGTVDGSNSVEDDVWIETGPSPVGEES